VSLEGAWNTGGGPQFEARIPFAGGEVTFAADFPPAMGGSGAAPSPLAYCFWGGLACYAMTFAQEAAQAGIELRGLRGRVSTEVDMTRALGVGEAPPVEGISWHLDVEADASAEQIAALKALADERCPGAYCIRNPIALETSVA
jgi:uncharacterized OsmC-like protein